MKNDLDIKVIPTCSSTNDMLVDLAHDGAKEGTVVVSTEQTKGKGRTGKSFYSPKDTGVYISILLRPDTSPEDSLYFTTIAAVATAKAIESVSDKKVDIKWVNDVYIEGKKVSGILTEAALSIEMNKLDFRRHLISLFELNSSTISILFLALVVPSIIKCLIFILSNSLDKIGKL